MPLPLIAIPVIHSSGAWIAANSTGYLAGTLSSTWIASFFLANTNFLAGLFAGISGLFFATISFFGAKPEKNLMEKFIDFVKENPFLYVVIPIAFILIIIAIKKIINYQKRINTERYQILQLENIPDD